MTQKVDRRLGNRKTSTGCATCKIRRVKCGEERPCCRRCTSTGRRCDGYTHLLVQPSSRSSPPTASGALADCILIAVDLDGDESRVFHFFTDIATSVITGWVDVEFWARTVPQLTQSQPAVRHAAITVGSLMLCFKCALTQRNLYPSGFSDESTLRAFALKQYGKAIRATLTTLKEEGATVELAMVTCILFICIEALQGHEKEAVALLRRGQAAIRDSTETVWDEKSPCKPAIPSTQTHIRNVFHNLPLQLKVFGQTPTDRMVMNGIAFHASPPTHTQPITSLAEARDELMHLLAFAQSIVGLAEGLKWKCKRSEDKHRFVELCARRDAAKAALHQWHSRVQDFVSLQNSWIAASLQQKYGVSMLLQRYHIIQVYLMGGFETAEGCYDSYTLHFSAIVNMATILFQISRKLPSDASFDLDLALIPPLYWTAIKCRNPTLRRRAASLLNNEPRHEGKWNSCLFSQVANKVIELEEEMPNIHQSSPTKNSLGDHEHALPPEDKRIKIVRINHQTISDGQEGHSVEFHTLPEGLTGEWQICTEFFVI